MDSYVINLERRTERLKRFKYGSDIAQVNVNVIKAIDGKQLETKNHWLGFYNNLERIRYLKRGEIACYLSHYKCMELSTTDHTLIFEDDGIVPYDFHYQIKKLMLTLPNDWDIALLGTTSLWRKKYRQRCKLVWENEDWAKYEGDIYGLQGYIINRKAINYLKDCKYPINCPIDIKINHCGLKVYVVKNNLIETRRLGSDTQ